MGYCIEHLPSRLSIGRETETGVTDIRIDCTDWLERWPGMVVAAIFCPPGGTPYILDTEMSGNSLVWHVRDTDTSTPGIGQLELTGEADGKRKLSALVDVHVARRLPGTAGDAPGPVQPWVDSVLGAAERITGMQVATETLEAGSEATAQWDGKAGLLTLGIPRGIVGPRGEKGDTGSVGPAGSDGITPAISVGTVTTLEAGSQATVTRRGTDADPIFDFGIPRGRDGSSITPTDDDMLELMASMGFVDPACADDGAVYTGGENTIFVL